MDHNTIIHPPPLVVPMARNFRRLNGLIRGRCFKKPGWDPNGSTREVVKGWQGVPAEQNVTPPRSCQGSLADRNRQVKTSRGGSGTLAPRRLGASRSVVARPGATRGVRMARAPNPAASCRGRGAAVPEVSKICCGVVWYGAFGSECAKETHEIRPRDLFGEIS